MTDARESERPRRSSGFDSLKPKVLTLMVDDSLADIGLMRFAFGFVKGRPMHVIEAHSGPSGIERARLEQPALILLDLTLTPAFGESSSPVIDGVEVIRQLRADEETAHIPILVLSGSPGSEERALFHGADAFRTKPPNVPAAKMLARDIVQWFFARQMPRLP